MTTTACPALDVDDFTAFFAEANGWDGQGEPSPAPFPWQSRLVATVAESASWPEVMGLPTGSGKTAVLLAAVFLLALDPAIAPRRTVMVVDRRVVVDQSYTVATKLARLLGSASRGRLASVRARLEALTGGDGPALVVARLRGGVPRNEDWAIRPDQPAVICSTVDQVGSRLLFQGYGVSPRMRSVHAGLLAEDCLVFLDEVHLSLPFALTLDRLQSLRGPGRGPLPRRSQHVVLSATPGRRLANKVAFPLWEGHEEEMPTALPLTRRLGASKPARLVDVRAPAGKDARAAAGARQAVCEAAVKAVGTLLSDPTARVLGVVVNRVDTARDIWRALAPDQDRDVVLLTGRVRPVERDALTDALVGRIGAGRPRRDDVRPVVVVATQCVEAGADYDFDGLVTECASLDALRQRFGRVDRLGEMAATGQPARSVVIGPSNTVALNAVDPVYGEAIAATWRWLQEVAEHGEVDFGPTSVAGGAVAPEDALSPEREAPRLLARELDYWAERQIARHASVPDVARFLHGEDTGPGDVQVVWRADLSRALISDAEAGLDGAGALARSVLAFCPPRSGESVPVPVWAVRAWLQGNEPPGGGGIADLEGGDDVKVTAPGELRPFIVWDGEASVFSTSADDLKPGSTAVVPCSYGGLTRADVDGLSYAFWDPSSTTTVADVAAMARAQSGTGRQCYRLLPPLLEGRPVPGPSDGANDGLDGQSAREVVATWLQGNGHGLLPTRTRWSVREFEVDPAHPEWLPAGVAPGQWRWFAISAEQVGGRDEGHYLEAGDDGETSTDPETSAFSAREVLLADHMDAVGKLARAFATGCGLSDELAADLELAGRLHDLGKCDPRFQAWLNDGYPRLEGEEPLAKSRLAAWDAPSLERARRLAAYPRGARHELLSSAMLTEAPWLARQAHDWELVRHLVSAHHGWGRPFLPAVPDIDVRVSFSRDGQDCEATTAHHEPDVASGAAERFWSLVQRYGHHGLAYMEALLRLADHEESRRERLSRGQEAAR